MGTRGREPRASALGWYEIGPWPESEGAFSSAQIGKRGGRYIRIYIVPIYSRCSDALLSWLLKNSVLHPSDGRESTDPCAKAHERVLHVFEPKRDSAAWSQLEAAMSGRRGAGRGQVNVLVLSKTHPPPPAGRQLHPHRALVGFPREPHPPRPGDGK